MKKTNTALLVALLVALFAVGCIKCQNPAKRSYHRPRVVQVCPVKNQWGACSTGFFISDKGHILTANHVIETRRMTVLGYPLPGRELADSVFVLWNRVGKFRARVVATLPEHDAAIIKIDGYQTPPYRLCREYSLGEKVTVYGRPEYLLEQSTGQLAYDIPPRMYLTGVDIRGGYSGSPLYSEGRECVVGLVQGTFGPHAYATTYETLRDFILDALK